MGQKYVQGYQILRNSIQIWKLMICSQLEAGAELIRGAIEARAVFRDSHLLGDVTWQKKSTLQQNKPPLWVLQPQRRAGSPLPVSACGHLRGQCPKPFRRHQPGSCQGFWTAARLARMVVSLWSTEQAHGHLHSACPAPDVMLKQVPSTTSKLAEISGTIIPKGEKREELTILWLIAC